MTAKQSFTVGRASGNDIVIDDPSVSRDHLEVQISDDGWSLDIVDLGSSFGTYVHHNGRWNQVMEATVEPDIRLRLGDYETTAERLVGSARPDVSSERDETLVEGREPLPQPATAPAQPESGREERPLGLVIICVLIAISVVVGLLSYIPLLFVGSAVGIPVWLSVLFLVFLVLTVLSAVVCYGLWTFQSWGLKLAIPVYAAVLVLNIAIEVTLVFVLKVAELKDIWLDVISIAIVIWILFYLTRPHIKELYGR